MIAEHRDDAGDEIQACGQRKPGPFQSFRQIRTDRSEGQYRDSRSGVVLPHGNCSGALRLTFLGTWLSNRLSVWPSRDADVCDLERVAAASNSRATWTADHFPPRAVGTPRSSRPAAMARSDSKPAACSSFIVGPRSERPITRRLPLLGPASRSRLGRQLDAPITPELHAAALCSRKSRFSAG